jgi:hypothetical protein
VFVTLDLTDAQKMGPFTEKARKDLQIFQKNHAPRIEANPGHG